MRFSFTLTSYLLYALLITMLSTASAFADTVEFENGQIMEVVILSEKEGLYTARCDVGVISFSKERVVQLDRAEYAKNRALLEGWLKKNKFAELADEPVYTVENKAAPSLDRSIRYGSEWLSEDEYAELKEKAKTTWIEKTRFAKERSRIEAEELGDETLIEQTKELISQGRTTRSNEANLLLKNYEWKHRKSEHFLVFYQDSALGRVITEKAEFFFNKVASDLGALKDISDALEKRIDIYVVDTKEAWDFVLQGKYLPDTPNGFSKIYKKEIFIYVSNDYDVEFALPHELSHIILRTYVNVRYNKDVAIPLWLYEGFANFQGNVINLSVSEQLLQRSIRINNHISLKELLTINNYPRSMDKKTLFYAQSTKLIQYIYLNFGRTKFLEFIDVYLREYYKYAATRKELVPKDGEVIMKRVIDLSFLSEKFTGFNSFEENWLKSLLQ
jgi:hypothetical protein